MLTPAQAASALASRRRRGMDDPTEPAPIRWYWDEHTGDLMRAGWRSLFPQRFPEHKRQERAA